MKSTASSVFERLLVDDALLAYIEWREESGAVWEYHRRWGRATAEDAVIAHAAYQAALDREEAAACAYANRLKRLADLLPSGDHISHGGNHDYRDHRDFPFRGAETSRANRRRDRG